MAFSAWMQRVYSSSSFHCSSCLEECFFVLWGVGDIVHARQRLVQFGDLILIVRLLLGRCFQIHCARFTAEGVEAGPGDVRALKEFLGLLQNSRMSQAMKST